MTKAFRLIFPLIAAIFAFTACNQDPTSVPSKLIPDEDKVEFNKFDTQELNVKQSSAYYEKLENLFGGDTRILGKNDYAKSSIMFSWDVYLPDSIISYIKNGQVNVKSSKVTMIRKYYLGDKSKNFDFTVQKITSDWDIYKINRDTLKFINRDAVDISFNKIITDTTVTFDLNKDVVFDWLKYKIDSNSTSKNNGIIISPTENTGYFIGFNATNTFASTPQTTISIVLEKPSSFLDTIAVYPNRDLHVVEKTSDIPVTQNKIYLEAGYALRGRVFFDLSAIPKNIAISKAILELTVDTLSTSDGNPKSDSLFVHMIKDSTKHSLTDDSVYTTIMVRNGDKFTGDISWMVQKWNAGAENQGLNLTLYDEFSSVARIVFYGSKESNVALRPRLTIYYPKKI